MHASVRWLNRYLSPASLAPDEACQVLMEAGFPIETREVIANDAGQPDERLDVEVTSNRGDCLSMVGLAREIAAKTGRQFVAPPHAAPKVAATDVRGVFALENQTPEVCPLFTARVIRGLKVGPSPAWLVDALASVGQRSINNVVDVTNFITFELGNPCHVFDLRKLAGGRLVVRYAREGEPLRTLDGKSRTLKANELVVADAERAQSLAGVIGGGDSEVDATTTDIVLEVATWDPVTIRRAARRLAIRTDAGYRFERIVDARTIGEASDRAASLLLEVAGGELLAGVLTAGGALPSGKRVTLRFDRCRAVLGYPVPDAEIERLLGALGFVCVSRRDGTIELEVPAYRTDVHQEIDLIEEVARSKGLSAVPVDARVRVEIRPPQVRRKAMREIGHVLTGLGFFETVTFSFVRPEQGKAWLPQGLEIVNVDDERRGAEPTLRPSLVPSLLACRKANQDGQAQQPGGVRLYEVSSVFAQHPGGRSAERTIVGLLLDVPISGKAPSLADRQAGVRMVRGAVESLCAALAGSSAAVRVDAAAPVAAGWDPEAFGACSLAGRPLGWIGLVSPASVSQCGLDGLYAAAEIDLDELIRLFPPRSRVEALPAFPAVERDLSPLVPEETTWDHVREVVAGAALPRLEGVSFVGVYRGKQIGAGRKSLTLRLRFRDAQKTLRHEEVDGEVAQIVERLNRECGASWRTA